MKDTKIQIVKEIDSDSFKQALDLKMVSVKEKIAKHKQHLLELPHPKKT